MITLQEAAELRDHLITELERTGYGGIVTQVISRLEEDPERDAIEQGNPVYFLNYFLSQAIDVFETISNDNYERLLNRFNEYLHTENNGIEAVEVELVGGNRNEPSFYDLKQLPSYKEIIEVLKSIQREINSDN